MKPTLTLAAATLAFAASVSFAHPPEHGAQPSAPAKQEPRAPLPPSGGRNLQILPQSILQRNLINTMQAFNRALGVECSYCHVPGDFASDDNPHKNVARGMMRMTWQLNNQILPGIAGLERPQVSCATCHRGAALPSTAAPAATTAQP